MSDDPEQIEERIEHTRARLSQNLDELGDRMSPGNLVDEALRYFETGPKEFAGSLGNQVRANPMGALLTAAGVAWMALGRGQDPMRRYTDPSMRDYRDPYAVGGYDDDAHYADASWDRRSDATYRDYDTAFRDYDDDDDGDSGRTYSRFEDRDEIGDYEGATTNRTYADPSHGDAYGGVAGRSGAAGSYGRSYDISDDEVQSYRSSIDTWRSIDRVRTETRRDEGETDSAYYRRLDDSYASTLNIERNDGEDDDTYRARVRAAVDTAGDKAREARRSLKQSAGRARRKLMEMRRQAGEYASDLSDEAAYRARLAKRRAAEFHDENPLVSGALALAAGALAGSLFPVSERERQALRPVAEDLIERGAALAEEGAERVEAYADQVERKAEEVRETSVEDMARSVGNG